MTASTRTPEDVVNNALIRMGRERMIGSLWEGSKSAQLALRIYAQTRDEVLRQFDWDFAERQVSMTLLKSAPMAGYFPPNGWTSAYPPRPWAFEYVYPTDCLKVRAVKWPSYFLYNPDPRAELFSIGNDAPLADPTAYVKVLLCNVPDAVIVYTGQVTDPSEWEADFVEAIAAALSRRLAPALVGLDPAKLEAQDEMSSATVAQRQEG